MAVTLLENTTTGYASSSPYWYEVAGSVTISSGSNRLLFASCHSRGNSTQADFQWCRIYSGYTDPTSRGTLLASLTSVLDVEADAILHAEYYVLKEADMPSNGTYTLVANAYESNPGAFQSGLGYGLFAGVDQTASPTTATNTTSGGSSISQSINPSGAGVVLDNYSGDGSASDWEPGDTTRDGELVEQYISSTLACRAAYNIISTGGSQTYSWSGSFQNRNALGIVFFPETGGAGAAATNVNWWGAHF